MPVYLIILFFSIALAGIYPPAEVGLFSIGPAKIQALDLVFFLTTLVLLKDVVTGRLQTLCRNRNKTFQSIVLYFIVSACFGILLGLPRYGYRAIGEARQSIVVLLFFFLTISTINSKNDIRLIIKALVYFQYLVVALAFLRLLGVFGDIKGSDGRLLNSTEAMHLFLVLVSVLYLQKEMILSKAHASFFIVFSILILIIAQIKTVWVIGAICGAAVVFGNKRYLVRNIVICCVALPLIYFTSSFILTRSELFASSFQRQAELLEQGSEGETMVWRILQWQQAFQMIRDHPITGVGFGSHNEEFTLPGTDESYPIHSAYIERALKTGIPSLLIFLLAVSNYWKSLKRKKRQSTESFDKAIISLCTLTVFSYLMFFVTYNDTPLLWIIIGIGYSLIYHRSNQVPENIIAA